MTVHSHRLFRDFGKQPGFASTVPLRHNLSPKVSLPQQELRCFKHRLNGIRCYWSDFCPEVGNGRRWWSYIVVGQWLNEVICSLEQIDLMDIVSMDTVSMDDGAMGVLSEEAKVMCGSWRHIKSDKYWSGLDSISGKGEVHRTNYYIYPSHCARQLRLSELLKLSKTLWLEARCAQNLALENDLEEGPIAIPTFILT